MGSACNYSRRSIRKNNYSPRGRWFFRFDALDLLRRAVVASSSSSLGVSIFLQSYPRSLQIEYVIDFTTAFYIVKNEKRIFLWNGERQLLFQFI